MKKVKIVVLTFICIVIAFAANINNNLVIKQRIQNEKNFIADCSKQCEKQYQNYSNNAFNAYITNEQIKLCIRGCSMSAKDLRDTQHKFAGSSIFKHIVGGIAITTANTLDGIVGGILYTIKALWNKDNLGKGVDVTTCDDLVFKMGLYYEWHYLGCRYDFLAKNEETRDERCQHYFFRDIVRWISGRFAFLLF